MIPLAGSPQRVAIALGSNLGDCRVTLEAALLDLDRSPGVQLLRRSSWYRSAPVGPPQPDYINGCALLAVSLVPEALLDRLQDFLLELGHGFCFEARQKRILIGDEHFFIDLVFYHRILKCHVLVELKTDAFRHEHLGQLNTYVAYYKKHQMTPGDQPPIGILLCTRKNDALVEFALGDLNNQVFVSRYAVELPRKEEMARFMTQISREAGA